MKREKAFSKNGFYMFVLESNLMLHQHVSDQGQQLLIGWLAQNPSDGIVRVLDLACGGSPISISKMLASCPKQTFHYTGVDINPDQIEIAKQFQFSNNVCRVTVIEGNAWDFSNLTLDNEYDIIYTGMNIHHGSPEEIYCLLLQCKSKLSKQGMFINHDFYRPANLPYLRRPQVNPCDSSDSFMMIDEETLSKFHLKAFDFSEGELQSISDWRLKFIEKYMQALRDKGAAEDRIEEMVAHVMSRDFPISFLQMKEIANKAGFELNIVELNAADQPLGEYFSLVTARPQ